MARITHMALRAGHPAHTPEAEPVVIDTDTQGRVVIELDDGEHIDIDAAELLAAITPAFARAA